MQKLNRQIYIYLNWFNRTILNFYLRFLNPKSDNEDNRRREFILNLLLFGIVVLLLSLNGLILFHSRIEGNSYQGMSIGVFSAITLPFLLLYGLSRIGYFILASYILIFTLLLGAVWGAYNWGLDLPSSLLSYAMLITMAGVLINTRFAVILTVLIALTTLSLGWFQSNQTILPSLHWKNKPVQPGDAFEYVLYLTIILAVSSLSTREIERSLVRARKSESELKQERDLLEIRVEERTSELKQAQLEKLAQMEKFVEFGKLSSGLFHDLANPLTALSLNLKQIKETTNSSTKQSEEYLQQAFAASRKVESFLVNAKKQLQSEESNKHFELNQEINDVIEILSHKARKAAVSLNLNAPSPIWVFGEPLKFYQVTLNLISNAIEACEERSDKPDKKITIKLRSSNQTAILSIQDCGLGIPQEHLENIFQPFFTTKRATGSLGLGLATTKQILAHSFQGTIDIQSSATGTTVTVKIPLK
jgi:signal transduction histidine kinase